MSGAIKEMDFEVLKKQIGKNIMRSLDSFKEKGQRAVLEHGNRKATIELTLMDVYRIKLTKTVKYRK